MMRETTDLKGWDHEGHPFSWPEFDEQLGSMSKPAHALGQPGRTVCGIAYPHVWHPNGESTGYTPPPKHQTAMRTARDRSVYCCVECCRALNIAHPALGTTSEPA